MTSQFDDPSVVGLDGTWRMVVEGEGPQDDYSITDEAATLNDARWIRDPSTVYREAAGFDDDGRRWVRSSASFPRSSFAASDIHQPHAVAWRPSRPPSVSSRDQQPLPIRVAEVPVGHQTSGPFNAPKNVQSTSANADQGSRHRGRPTSRSSQWDDAISQASSYFPAPVTSRSRRASTTAEDLPRVRITSSYAHIPAEPQPRRTTKPSPPKLDSEMLPGANTMADIWPLYVKHTFAEDREMVKAWNTDLDAILIFAALFSAVLTTFIIESYTNLQADPTSEVLQSILFELQMARNVSAAQALPLQQFKVAASAVRVNIYWFSSLILSLATALIAILAKQWVNYLLAGLSPIPANRARHRQYRIDGMHRWHLPSVLSFLPILLHIALLLFFAGLVDFVWDVNRSVAVFSAVLVCVTFVVYVIANVLAYVYPDCPFKTSVSVVFSLVINLVIIAYRRICFAMVRIWRAAGRIWSQGLLVCMSCCRRLGHIEDTSIEDGVTPLSRAGTIAGVETRNYDSLRIASLRSDDEQYIEDNKTAMDARILLWLMRNADRLHEVEKLSNAIIHFPDLVIHRQLFIQQGAFLFLERLLQSSVPSVFSKLSEEQRRAATSAMHALAVLESEADMARLEDKVDHEVGVANGPHATSAPYLEIKATTNPATSPLSSSTFPVILSILDEADTLSLSMVASALRLCVRIPDSTQRSRAQSMTTTIQSFLQRLAKCAPDSPDEPSDITHAVNTVVYLALQDGSYPDRQGFSTPPMGDTRYWLDYLSMLVARPFLTLSARRQICWAICALAPSLRGSRAGMIVKPRVPRVSNIRAFAVRLTALVSYKTDPDVIRAALIALESLLWRDIGDEQGDVTYVANLLIPAHISLTAEIQLRLKQRKVHVSKIAVLPSITRIALFLARYHTATADDARTTLLRNVFRIFAFLLQATTQDPASVYIDMYVVSPQSCHSWPGARRLQGAGVRRWIYWVASQIITQLSVGATIPRGTVPLPIDPFELVFSANSNTPIASALNQALHCIGPIVTSAPNGSGQTVDPSILNSFTVILKDVFLYAIQNVDLATTESQGTAVRNLNWPATRIVARLAECGGLWKLLVVSSHIPAVQVSVLRTALRTIRAVLFADTKQGWPSPPILRHDPSHPAIILATMFRGQYILFCRELMEHVQGGRLKWPDMEGALVDFISLSGNLAFYSAPQGAQLPDELVIGNLLPFLVTLMVPVGNEPGPTSSVVRRHAWGTLGSIGTLYTVDAEELRDDSNPQRHFLFETFEADDLAVGLLRALMLPSTGSRPDIEPQFRVGRSGNVRKLEATADQRATFKDISSAALKAIAALWKAEDSESVEVRDCLRRHGLAAHLRPLSEVDGEATEYSELANEIMARIFDAERDTPPDSPNIPR